MRKTLAALTAAAAVTLVPSANAAAPQSFYGVSSQTALTAEEYEMMSADGVGTLRAILSWAQVDQSAAADDYDWSSFDGTVRESARNGLAVLPFLYGTPEWVAKGLDNARCSGAKCAIFPPKKAAALDAWKTFVGDVAKRYGPDGEFWTENPDVPKRPIEDWQIWNEMNSKSFYAPKPTTKGYAKLLDIAATEIRAVDANAEIILGGMPALDGSKKAIPGPDYLKDLYRVSGVAANADGVGIHPYGASLAKITDQVKRFDKETKKDKSAKLWITEVGAGSAGGGNPLNLGKKGQANLLADAFKYFERKRGAMKIANVTWFSWRDSAEKICAWCPTSGLYTKSLKPKPSQKAFVKAAR